MSKASYNIQNHLSKKDTINLGSYYTSPYLVNIAYNLIKNYINIKNFAILDNSCGYGEFLKITHTR
ncbi:adenine methyltransferase, partial [Campylobacter jejuni]|nr:adenine methyltransferase [Campylobacter jejuni]EAJ1633526.1 adenine methyltransferase [Campylobacter upsaliensis]EAJ6771192.1 adenine methyltransferase [Campylobacter jejuni]EAJ8891696.1 adenine methyltransferase [Campylobacter jejuni]EAL4164958.1 adenine methyltransferase [Campylobacter jejuni]